MSNETKEEGSGIAASSQPDVQEPVVTFESLTFSDGSRITLEPTDVVVFVGPNNSGKSVALRELEEHIGPPLERAVVKAVTLRRSGSEEDLGSYLEKHAQKKGNAENLRYFGYRFEIVVRKMGNYWRGNLTAFRNLFCMRLSTEKRLKGLSLCVRSNEMW